MTTFSKETCAALKEMGVKTESEFMVYARYKDDRDPYSLISKYERASYSFDDVLPAYVLSDLPHVLREIGEIKGWKEKQLGIYVGMDGRVIEPWKYHFLWIAQLFAEGGMEKAEEYLLMLI